MFGIYFCLRRGGGAFLVCCIEGDLECHDIVTLLTSARSLGEVGEGHFALN